MQSTLSPALSLVNRAALVTGISASKILGDRKTRRLVHTRWAIWLVIRRQGFSLTEISEMFARDHGTILYAVNHAGRLLDKDTWFKALVNHLSAETSPA